MCDKLDGQNGEKESRPINPEVHWQLQGTATDPARDHAMSQMETEPQRTKAAPSNEERYSASPRHQAITVCEEEVTSPYRTPVEAQEWSEKQGPFTVTRGLQILDIGHPSAATKHPVGYRAMRKTNQRKQTFYIELWVNAAGYGAREATNNAVEVHGKTPQEVWEQVRSALGAGKRRKAPPRGNLTGEDAYGFTHPKVARAISSCTTADCEASLFDSLHDEGLQLLSSFP